MPGVETTIRVEADAGGFPFLSGQLLAGVGGGADQPCTGSGESGVQSPPSDLGTGASGGTGTLNPTVSGTGSGFPRVLDYDVNLLGLPVGAIIIAAQATYADPLVSGYTITDNGGSTSGTVVTWDPTVANAMLGGHASGSSVLRVHAVLTWTPPPSTAVLQVIAFTLTYLSPTSD